MDEEVVTKSICFTDPLNLIYLDSLQHPILSPIHQSRTQLQTLVIKQVFSVKFVSIKLNQYLKYFIFILPFDIHFQSQYLSVKICKYFSKNLIYL